MKPCTFTCVAAITLLPGAIAAGQIQIATTETVLSDVGIRPVNMTVANLNADLRPDFIIANRGPTDLRTNGDVSVLLSNGGGGWTIQQVLEDTELFTPYALALKDIDGDDIAELIVGDANGTDIYRYVGIGNGAFDPVPDAFPAGNQIFDIDLDQVDNDSIDDVVVANLNFGTDTSLLRGLTGGQFDSPEFIPAGLAGQKKIELIDLAQNGHLDIVVAGSDRGFNVIPGLGNGVFDLLSNFSLNGAFGGRFVFGDIDNDGKKDIVIDHIVGGGALNALSMRRNTSLPGGSIDFALAEVISLNANAEWVNLGDLDNDGFLDIVVTHVVGESIDVSILRNNSGIDFEAPIQRTLSQTSDQAQAVNLVDFDMDGDLDIVLVTHDVVVAVQNSTVGRLVVVENLKLSFSSADLNGDGVVNGADLANLLGNWGVCDPAPPAPCPGDLNGDGLVDGVDLANLLANWTPPAVGMLNERDAIEGTDLIVDQESQAPLAVANAVPWVIQQFGFDSIVSYMEWIWALDQSQLQDHILNVLELLLGE